MRVVLLAPGYIVVVGISNRMAIKYRVLCPGRGKSEDYSNQCEQNDEPGTRTQNLQLTYHHRKLAR
jgi:hypothetical protein